MNGPLNDLPTAPPLPDDVRARALDAVLVGMDPNTSGGRGLPVRRIAGPLLVAAAVVTVVLGAATVATTMRAAGPTGVEVGSPISAGSSSPVVPPPVAPPTDQPLEGGAGNTEPVDRCRTAVGAFDRAADYPDLAGWTVTGEVPQTGADELIVVDEKFLCLASPATVSVSATRGTPQGGVEIVRVAPGWLGVLNPAGATVSWQIGGRSSEASFAPVLGIHLDRGVSPAEVRLTVDGRDVGPLPEPGPAPIVLVDHPKPPRDMRTADGAALDPCIAPPPSVGPLDPGLAADSEPELWQPLMRAELPGGGFAMAAVIGDRWAGLCVRSGEQGPYSWFGGRHNPAPVADGAAPVRSFTPEGTPVRAWLFEVGYDVVRAELAAGSATAPCEVRNRLALCTAVTSGTPVLSVYDAAGRGGPVPGAVG